MTDESTILARATWILSQLRMGKTAIDLHLSADLGKTAEEKAFVEEWNPLLDRLCEEWEFITQISRGKFEVDSPRDNVLAGPIKQLQAELRHLVWQVERLAAGDYNQQVFFMGAFSDSFNKLIHSLRENQQLHEQITRSEELYKTMVRISPDGITLVDMDGRQKLVSEKGAAMFGYELDELIGKDFHMVLTEEGRKVADEKLGLLLQGQYTGPARYQTVKKSGETIWIEANAEVIRNQNGDPESIMLVYRDVSAKVLLETQLQEYSSLMEFQARMDRMTGVFNRAAGLELLEMELLHEVKNGKTLSVSFLDIDGLKTINDTYGHAEGDRAIQALVGCVKKCIRTSDIVVRMGGDEFLVIYPDCSAETAGVILRRIETHTLAARELFNLQVPLEFSYGIATTLPQEEITSGELIRQADEAMYRLKKSRKAQAQHLTSEIDDR
jgi:diguanylate cyclase (GGDEF)-like protein/PAS domain S-box-containing protein